MQNDHVAGQRAVKLSREAFKSSKKRLISERDEAVAAERTAESRRKEAGAAHTFSESRAELRNLHVIGGIWTVARNKEKLMAWRGRSSGRTASRTAKVQDAYKESGATEPVQAADDMDIEDLDRRNESMLRTERSRR